GGTFRARIFGPDVLDHDQGRRNVFELFTDFGADALPQGAAVGARELFGGNVVNFRLAGQARGQRLAAMTIRLGLGRTRSRRRLGDRIGLRGGLGLGLGLRQDVL